MIYEIEIAEFNSAGIRAEARDTDIYNNARAVIAKARA